MRLSCLALSVLLTSYSGLFAAGDSPALSAPSKSSWTSFRNGAQQRGVSHTTLPEKLTKLWEYPTEFGVTGTAAIVGDHVYVPILDGFLLCLM